MDKRNPLFSIIVPIYNVETELNQCVQSLVSQTYHNIEIILVDDGSTDTSSQICDRFAHIDERVIVIHKKNEGLVNARKSGVEVAGGEYIGFVDGDDYVALDLYEKLAEILKDDKIDIVCQGFKWIYEDGHVKNYKEPLLSGRYEKKRLIERVYPTMMCNRKTFYRQIAPSICTKTVRKSILKKRLGMVDENIRDGEDALISYPCLYDAECVYIANEVQKYFYRVHEKSMSHKHENQWLQNAISFATCLEKQFANCKEIYITDSMKFEKFYMIYRYIYREIVYCKKENRAINQSLDEILDTAIGHIFCSTNIARCSIPWKEKIFVWLCQRRKYRVLTFLVNNK